MKVGLYEVVGQVAVSARSSVWKGRDPALGRDVALKQLAVSSPDARDELAAEARILARLHHPHIVQVYDLIQRDAESWLVEEWVDGASLRRVAAGAGRLTVEQTLGIVRGALLGLAYAHAHGVVHGDFAPNNILVETTGESKLVDFGHSGQVGRTGAGGTPGYSSPEALDGLALDPTADVYSAAAVMARALRGQSLVQPSSVAAAGVDLEGVRPGVRAVLERALAPDSRDRYRDAQEFLEAFEHAAEDAFGTGWWTTAGVGSAAAAAGPAALVAAGVGVVGEAGGVAPVVVGRAAGTKVGKLAVSSHKALLLVAAAALVALTSVGVATVVSPRDTAAPGQEAIAVPSTSPSIVPVPEPTPTPTSTPTPTNPVAGLTGTYKYVEQVTSVSDPSYGKVGSKTTATWQVSTVCDDTCVTSGSDQDGGDVQLPVKGRGWGESTTVKRYCVDSETGKEARSDPKIPLQTTTSIKVVKTKDGLVVLARGTSTYQQLKLCENQRSPRLKIVSKITLTLVS